MKDIQNLTIYFCLLLISFFSCQLIAQEIPSDAVLFKGHYYKVYDNQCSWHEAVKKCEALGGILASIKSKEVDDFIFKLSSGKCLWIGASDEIVEGEWLWRDGSKMGYKHWAPEEPDNWKGKEDWSVIGWPGERFKNGRWGDTVADERLPITGFICEWESS
ncbi:lectin-like protein [Flavivirga spongiicola]|uniref:C-type lectin domain-containing protein n=1 Tax=Flavivirga spongiicola TaxID=421621 RepID=A0ABU7XUN3_9FLAO|nr:lectin-like protein [Flavivirga sp. MEBiC05379]MDO5979495.1 lectin-like protein [Flavivirga sp. MEBiC05379]